VFSSQLCSSSSSWDSIARPLPRRFLVHCRIIDVIIMVHHKMRRIIVAPPRVLNQRAAPQVLVPGSRENFADDPLNEGLVIPCVIEKTAIGVAVQVPKQVCQPFSCWMFWITCAVLGIVTAASGFTAAPNATSKAKVRATKLGRTTSFSLFILGEPFFLKRRIQIFYFLRRWRVQMFLKCIEKQSRCGNQKGMRLWDYEEKLTT
jgi:hypothetical protein